MKSNNTSDYRTYGLEKIDSKKPKKSEPKANKISGKSDLRGNKNDR